MSDPVPSRFARLARLERSARLRGDPAMGFSLVEMIILAALVTLAATLALPLIRTTVDYYDAEAALQLVAAQLRRAAQEAIDMRRRTRVVFEAPNRVITARYEAGSWRTVGEYTLPGGFEFHIDPALPTSEDATPDGLGASAAVDFAGDNEIYFLPDATAVNASGQVTSGIVYLGRPGEPSTARAVTVFGTTARVRAWRFVEGKWQ
ncbi:MAG: hypothetical protein Kow00109_01720 [Acidobacteriota bacterium]